MNIEYEIIGNTIPFDKSAEMYSRSTHNGIADNFLWCLNNAGMQYRLLINKGLKPQEARAILPNVTKTELVMTGFESDWEHFFELRCSGAAHPDARKLADELKSLMNVKNIELNSVK